MEKMFTIREISEKTGIELRRLRPFVYSNLAAIPHSRVDNYPHNFGRNSVIKFTPREANFIFKMIKTGKRIASEEEIRLEYINFIKNLDSVGKDDNFTDRSPTDNTHKEIIFTGEFFEMDDIIAMTGLDLAKSRDLIIKMVEMCPYTIRFSRQFSEGRNVLARESAMRAYFGLMGCGDYDLDKMHRSILEYMHPQINENFPPGIIYTPTYFHRKFSLPMDCNSTFLKLFNKVREIYPNLLRTIKNPSTGGCFFGEREAEIMLFITGLMRDGNTRRKALYMAWSKFGDYKKTKELKTGHIKTSWTECKAEIQKMYDEKVKCDKIKEDIKEPPVSQNEAGKKDSFIKFDVGDVVFLKSDATDALRWEKPSPRLKGFVICGVAYNSKKEVTYQLEGETGMYHQEKLCLISEVEPFLANFCDKIKSRCDDIAKILNGNFSGEIC